MSIVGLQVWGAGCRVRGAGCVGSTEVYDATDVDMAGKGRIDIWVDIIIMTCVNLRICTKGLV